MSQRSLIQGVVSLTFAALSFIVIATFFRPAISSATLWVLGWAGIESIAAFYGLSWSLGRSSKTFLIMFFGGMLLRLVSLGVVAYVLVSLKMNPAPPLLALVTAYFVLSMIQMPFLKPAKETA